MRTARLVATSAGCLFSLLLASGETHSDPARGQDPLAVAKKKNLSGETKYNAWFEALTKLEEDKVLNPPVYVIAHLKTIDEKGQQSETVVVIPGKKRSLAYAASSRMLVKNGAPVWLRRGSLETRSMKSGKPDASMPLVQENLSPKTMKSMHHHNNFAIIEFSEDKAGKKWKAEARILAKPLSKDISLKLFN